MSDSSGIKNRRPDKNSEKTVQTSSQTPQTVAKSDKPVSRNVKAAPGFPWNYLFLALLAIAVLVTVASLGPAFYEEFAEFFGPVSPNKPFRTFSDFYPFYLSEHSNMTNRRLHLVGTSISIIVLLLNHALIQCLIVAFGFAYISCTFFAAFPHGLFEGLVMLFTFLGLAKTVGKVKPAVIVLLIGYAFAWVGHFYFELNKPATFIYPSYSLIGDFRMWFDCVVAGTVPGLWK